MQGHGEKQLGSTCQYARPGRRFRPSLVLPAALGGQLRSVAQPFAAAPLYLIGYLIPHLYG
ncbi:hypothetical protein DLM85_14720 [Hymenobacter edaphi]|uniref:Uncharacterized protein n=1 Tax=Hymenobacter edaphi TaxID=2211146 RepID=A0A328BEV4_9BACT|nr:hypothetical protein DLM85_14720 [Hymenobacter edaphi]